MGKRILEVGTGKGRFAIELARCGANVTAIDISKEMLKIASKRAEQQNLQNQISFEEGDAEDLKYPANYFDVVMCLQTLMHVPNKRRCLGELARVVKQNGVIVVDDINKDHRWRIAVRGWKNFVKAVLLDVFESPLCLPLRIALHVAFLKPLNPAIVKRTTQKEFTQMVEDKGVKIEQIINYCPVYFLIVARKNE
jgi:ubiquinone/menaquinone biosynthesis C-methylase UbiE